MRLSKVPRFDWIFLTLLFILLISGLLLVFEATSVYAENKFSDKRYFVTFQSVWVIVGLIGMFAIGILDLSKLKKLSPYLFLVNLLLLIPLDPLFPVFDSFPFNEAIYGARRWIRFNPSPLAPWALVGRLSFQPSELLKLTCVIFSAAILSKYSMKMSKEAKIKFMFAYMLISVVAAGLVARQPDFTTAFVIFTQFMGVYFFSHAPLILFSVMIPLVGTAAAIFIGAFEYRRIRLTALFSPESLDKAAAGYHIRQIMISLGSGGLFGLGIGMSRQKYSYLPEVMADSIFSILGEELGWVGATLLVILFALFILRAIRILKNTDDTFLRLIGIGVITWISVQTFLNLGGVVRILPLTGVPLPFISYGGSSIVFLLWGIGFILNASQNARINKNAKKH